VTYPVTVKLVARVQTEADKSSEQLLAATVQLRHENDQVTAFRFRLDGRGHLVAGSTNNVYKELRTAAR